MIANYRVMFNEHTISCFLESLQNEIQEVTKKMKMETDKDKRKQKAKYLDVLVELQSKLIRLTVTLAQQSQNES